MIRGERWKGEVSPKVAEGHHSSGCPGVEVEDLVVI